MISVCPTRPKAESGCRIGQLGSEVTRKERDRHETATCAWTARLKIGAYDADCDNEDHSPL
jgi:hypothetical protein